MGNYITRFVVVNPMITVIAGIFFFLILGFIIMKFVAKKDENDQIEQDDDYKEDKVYINKNKGQVKKYQ